MEEVLRLCANYGFPMVVAFYLLVRLEPVIRELERSVTALTIVGLSHPLAARPFVPQAGIFCRSVEKMQQRWASFVKHRGPGG